MDGTFFITLNYLKELGACDEGQQEFQRVFPDGGEYQTVLDRCAEERRIDFGFWLLHHMGASNDKRIYTNLVNDPERIVIFAGDIEFKDAANIKHIIVGRGIKAGEDFFIFAGLRVRKSRFHLDAVVSANVRPENLMSGYWVPNKKEDQE